MRTTIRSSLCRVFPVLFALGGVPVAPGVAQAADYDLAFVKTGPTRADLSWKTDPYKQYLVCWKLDAAGGDVCGQGSNQTTASQITPNNSNYVNGRVTITLWGLDQCNREYKVRVRRTLVAFDTQVFWFPC
ncbi:hypothetical protein [Nannocystis sp.]|uniref:hypothetical protein n=1 Tax=Nannocystis sp. TaxID=1962667 RepID=UPI0025EF9DE4|nr:hypothetical protein [Nannocystis sp.]MBK7829772.1 hypothetical protein [Nannocystis sp.]